MFGIAGSLLGGSIGGAALGYLGVKDTNKSNEGIASARNAMEIAEAEKARDFSKSEASVNRAFQAGETKIKRNFDERMSSTAVQRRMEDMRKSGINPILAGKFDASSPSAAAASGGIGATAKANSQGYTAQNKYQAALDNLSTVLQLQKLSAEARTAGNTAKVTTPPAQVADDVSNAYKGAKSNAEKMGTAIGSSAYDIKESIKEAYNATSVEVGKITNQIYDKGKKMMTNPNLNSPFYRNRIETNYSHGK